MAWRLVMQMEHKEGLSPKQEVNSSHRDILQLTERRIRIVSASFVY